MILFTVSHVPKTTLSTGRKVPDVIQLKMAVRREPLFLMDLSAAHAHILALIASLPMSVYFVIPKVKRAFYTKGNVLLTADHMPLLAMVKLGHTAKIVSILVLAAHWEIQSIAYRVVVANYSTASLDNALPSAQEVQKFKKRINLVQAVCKGVKNAMRRIV